MPKLVAQGAMDNRDTILLCECRCALEIAGGRGHFYFVDGPGKLDQRLWRDPGCSDDTDPHWAASLAESEAAR